MTIIEATFIGEDGSLGYQTGRRYRLKIEEGSAMQGEYPLWIVSPNPCPYGSFDAFLRNWSSIEWVGDHVHVRVDERVPRDVLAVAVDYDNLKVLGVIKPTAENAPTPPETDG